MSRKGLIHVLLQTIKSGELGLYLEGREYYFNQCLKLLERYKNRNHRYPLDCILSDQEST